MNFIEGMMDDLQRKKKAAKIEYEAARQGLVSADEKFSKAHYDVLNYECELYDIMLYRAIKNGETTFLPCLHAANNLRPIRYRFCLLNFCDPANESCRCSIFSTPPRSRDVQKEALEWGFIRSTWRDPDSSNFESRYSKSRSDIIAMLSPRCTEVDRQKVMRDCARDPDVGKTEFDEEMHSAANVYSYFETETENARRRVLLLCARGYDSTSLIYHETFPLDIFKMILHLANLIPPRDPLSERRTELIAWKKKGCYCLK